MANNIYNFDNYQDRSAKYGGGEPPMGSFEKRVESLEKGMSLIETDIAVIKSNYATRSDIAELKSELTNAIITQTRWMMGFMATTAGISLAAAKYIF